MKASIAVAVAALIGFFFLVNFLVADDESRFWHDFGIVQGVSNKEFMLKSFAAQEEPMPETSYFAAPMVTVDHPDMTRLLRREDHVDIEYVVLNGRKVVTGLRVVGTGEAHPDQRF